MCVTSVVARERLGKNVTAATNTHKNRRIGRVVFSVINVSRSRRLVLPELLVSFIFDGN
jgi:hypothetical protein